jgi:hypothetical protein
LVLGGVVFFWKARDLHERTTLTSHRSTAIAVTGLGWWLLLPLGFGGLLMMMLAAVSEVRQRRGRTSPGA